MDRARIIFFMLALAGVFTLQAQHITFTATVDRNTIEAGEQLKLTVTLQSPQGRFSYPDLGGLVVVQGPFPQETMIVINGRPFNISSRTWSITAIQPGTYTIGPAKAQVGNSILQTEPITIVVERATSRPPDPAVAQGQRQNPNLFMTMTLSRNKAYVGEPVVLSYDVYHRYSHFEAGNQSWPVLNGFWTEEIQLQNEQARIERVNGIEYRVVTLRRQLIYPQRSGKLRIGSAELLLFVNPRVFSRGTPVQVTTNELEFTAVDLPGNPPQGFTGAVGELEMSMDADRTSVAANEALEISVIFKGRANLKLLDAPTLQLPREMEVYDPKVNDKISTTTNGMSGQREFQYVVIPRHDGTYDLEPLIFHYFDPRSATYKTIRSETITLEVTPGTPGQASGSPRTGMRDVAVLEKDIRYLRTGELDLRPHGSHLFGSVLWTVGMAAPALAFMLFQGWHRRQEAELADASGTRRKKADKVARHRLSEAERALKLNDRESFYTALSKALNGYLADKFGLGVADMNAGTVRAQLAGYPDGEALSEQYVSLITACDMARFAPVEQMPRKELYEQAVDLIGNIERKR